MKNHNRLRFDIRAFTLIEMVIVMAIIFLVISFSVGGYHKVRQYAIHATCLANLKSLSYSINLYFSEYDGRIIPSKNAEGDRWATILVENEYLHEGRDFEPSHLDSGTAREVGTEPLFCPNDFSDEDLFFKDKFAAGGSYAINRDISSSDTTPRYWSHIQNASEKILLCDYNQLGIENDANYRVSALGNTNNWQTGGSSATGTIGTTHFGGANCLFADWHVEHRTSDDLSDDNFSLEMDFN